jgi:EAL domain-containing protein (putative c-di-GMP-specific phosphodiesterase class I)
MAETVLQAIAEPFTFGTAEAQVELTVSIGIALAPCGRDLVATVARQANSALQGAKLSGKARFMIYDERQGARVRRKEMLERDLAQALARQEFSVLYQPIINLADESIHGMEALLRWHHPELGEVTPAEFIPLAESTGMIHSLGGWVIEEAVSRLGSWLGHDPGLLLAINLSPRQLESREFLRNFTHALGRHGVPHRNLMLELTETYLIQNVKRNARALDRFTDMGFSIAIDDFGSGYSSLKYLQHLPVTHLKIDRSFISESVHDARSLTLLEAIIQIADKLELTVIAEGVETPGQAETLRRAGCRLAQGFLFSNPLAAADLTALIGRR